MSIAMTAVFGITNHASNFALTTTNFILYDPAINIHIISYLLTKKKRKEREKSFLFCLYYSAINIHVFMLGN